MKTCTNCHIEKPLTDYWSHQNKCADCCRMLRAEKRKSDSAWAEMQRVRVKDWKSKNREYTLEAKREWNKKNKDHNDEYARKRLEAMTPEEKRRHYRLKYLKNQDHQRKLSRDYYNSLTTEQKKEVNRLRGIARAAQGNPHNERRRAAMNSVTYERVIRQEIIDRDKRICYLCNTLVPDDPRALAIDHVIPISKGGPHTADNMRVTCRRCNGRKSDKLLSELDWYTPVS